MTRDLPEVITFAGEDDLLVDLLAHLIVGVLPTAEYRILYRLACLLLETNVDG